MTGYDRERAVPVLRPRWWAIGLVALAVTAAVAAARAENYSEDMLANKSENRFWESDYLGQRYYVILDRETGCKYLAFGQGHSFAITVLIGVDGKPDCSGPKRGDQP